jgi:hypothetical protein
MSAAPRWSGPDTDDVTPCRRRAVTIPFSWSSMGRSPLGEASIRARFRGSDRTRSAPRCLRGRAGHARTGLFVLTLTGDRICAMTLREQPSHGSGYHTRPEPVAPSPLTTVSLSATHTTTATGPRRHAP